MSGDIDVTYQDMKDASKHMDTKKKNIDETLNELKKYIDNLLQTGYVTRQSSKAFQESFDEFKTGATKTMEGLTGLAKYLDTAAKNFEQIDQDLAKAAKGGG